MKKVKKLLAMIMAMTMVLGLGLTSFAAKTGATITVDGLSTANTQNVSIYEIYRLDEKNNEWVLAEWAKNTGIATGQTEVSSEVLEELMKAKNTTTPDATKSTSANSGTVTFTQTDGGEQLQAGAYLVVAVDTGNKVTYQGMVALTYKYNESNLIEADTNVGVTAKAETWSTEKNIIQEEENDSVYQVGDIITYEIRTTVPVDHDTFTVTDTITNAEYYFTGSEDAVWNVTVGGQVTQIGAPSVNPVSGQQNQQTFTVDLSSLLDRPGQEVVITYTAKIDGNVDEITNSVSSSHDSTPDTEKAYTGNMTITKKGEIPAQGTEEDRPVLKGAEFVVYREVKEDDVVVAREYATLVNNYVTGWTKVEVDGSGDCAVPDQATHVVTGDNGKATVYGFDLGIYYFQEVVAPAGYSINPIPEICTIEKINDAEGVVVSGSATMYDSKLASLPSTGGIGTTIFTIGGCAIMIAAAALYFASKRKSEEN